MITWIVCGAGPSAAVYLVELLGRYPDATTITTNAAIELFDGRRLDYYWSHDHISNGRYGQRAIDRPGTRTITLRREASALKARGVSDFDEFVEIINDQARGQCYRGGYSGHLGLSGLYCIQYALNNGGTELHIVGQEGYRSFGSKLVPDYFDGTPGMPQGDRHVRTLIAPFMQHAVEVWPEVMFIFYGDLAYEVKGPNVRRVCHDPIHA